MVTRIQRHGTFKNNQKMLYVVHDEDTTAEFGYIILDKQGNVTFRLTEEKALSMDEIQVIDEFMQKIHRIENDDELNTLQEIYYFSKHERT